MLQDLREDEAFVDWLHEQLNDAESYTDNDIVADERQQALNYYLRRPMGDERAGRSQVVSGDVYAAVEGVSTAIADIYCSNADAVQFVGRGPDDMEKAEQRTETVNYTFWTTCQGYLPLLESIKSGVQQKTGVLTWYWQKERRLTKETYRQQTEDSIALLLSDLKASGCVVKDVQAEPSPDGTMTVTLSLVREQGRIVVESIPPEHLKVSPLARSADVQKAPALFLDHYKTAHELLKCGYGEDAIERLEFGQRGWRDQADRNADRATSSDEQARITTAWVECDRDGDGIVELHKTVFSGDVLLEDEIIDEINVATWTPNIQPHEYFGRCPADDAIQSQRINTTLWRQGLDSLYHSTNPQWRLDPNDDRVNIEDFYNPEIGKPLRAPPGSAEPVALPFVGQHVFPMLEYSKAETENLTGFTRYSQGMDAKSLNDTATGIKIVTNMSQQRVRMMARNYGEMCLSRCMRGIAKLLSQHSEKPLAIRIRGQYVQVDPREWAEEFDMTVNVGLGTVDAEAQVQKLGLVAQAQGAAAQGGALGKFLTPKNIYNVQRRIAELAGLKDPSFAWTDPDLLAQQPQQPPPPPPEVQKEQMRIQADAQKFQAQTQVEGQRFQVELQDKQAERQHDAELQIALAKIKEQAQTERELMLERLRLSMPAEEMGRQATVAVDGGVQALLQQMDAMRQELAQALSMAAGGIAQMVDGKAVVKVERIKGPDGRLAKARVHRADGSVTETAIQ